MKKVRLKRLNKTFKKTFLRKLIRDLVINIVLIILFHQKKFCKLQWWLEWPKPNLSTPAFKLQSPILAHKMRVKTVSNFRKLALPTPPPSSTCKVNNSLNYVSSLSKPITKTWKKCWSGTTPTFILSALCKTKRNFMNFKIGYRRKFIRRGL